jgi:hypothetical protein
MGSGSQEAMRRGEGCLQVLLTIDAVHVTLLSGQCEMVEGEQIREEVGKIPKQRLRHALDRCRVRMRQNPQDIATGHSIFPPQ